VPTPALSPRHGELPIYGGGLPEAVPCATGILATGLVFAARTASGAHYLSDNMIGLVVGSGSALVPWALHYGMDDSPEREGAGRSDEPELAGVMLAPDPQGGGGLLSFNGSF
jgi:hypothetical protein